MNILSILLIIDVSALFVLLVGILWSVAKPDQRIWPPPSKQSWQYTLAWILFYLVFGLNTLLLILDWNSWILHNPLRFLIGFPCIIIGSILLIWGVKILGTGNTSGLAEGFIRSGPYRFTINPQYLGDIILFIGLSITANSELLWITHILLILVFVITPLAEEDWLKAQYGDQYRSYLKGTSRFL